MVFRTRVTAHRWPANPDGVNRTDDRPTLAGVGANDDAWRKVYLVGRADRDWLLARLTPGAASMPAARVATSHQCGDCTRRDAHWDNTAPEIDP